MKPGDHASTCRRASPTAPTGTADSLRWFAFVNDPLTDVHGRQRSHRQERVPRDPAQRSELDGSERAGNAEEERDRRGADDPLGSRSRRSDDRRARLRLPGRTPPARTSARSTAASTRCAPSTSSRAVAGKKGHVEPIFRAPHLEIKTYNITGEQLAFHRALRSEEIRIQFRGDAKDMSELENAHRAPGRRDRDPARHRALGHHRAAGFAAVPAAELLQQPALALSDRSDPSRLHQHVRNADDHPRGSRPGESPPAWWCRRTNRRN